MWQALAVNIVMLVAGVAGGILTGSLAVLADAGHVLSDVGAILLGLLGATLASRSAGPRWTFGLQRSEVFAALVNGLTLVAVAVAVAVAAIGRLQDPPEVEGAGVLALGVFGFTGNVLASWILARGDRSDVNLEGVLRHSLADALGSLVVTVAGALVLATGWLVADPVASLVLATLILLGSVRLVAEPLGVLMETAPAGVDVDALGRALCEVDGVVSVHELHVWTVTPGFVALSAHVVVDRVDRDAVRRRLEYLLGTRFGLRHTTLQIEEEAEEGALLQVQNPLQAP